jgi:hypothetical protein
VPNSISSPVVSSIPDSEVDEILKRELIGLQQEIAKLVAGGMSDEDAEAILSWARGLEGEVRMVASILRDPNPMAISQYLRVLASNIESSKSRRLASFGVNFLRSALSRAVHS